jgi:AraC-like DNA-binding protein
MTPDARPAPFPTYFGEFSDAATMSLALHGEDISAERGRMAGPVDKSLRSSLARGALGRLNVAVGRFGQGIPQTSITENTHTFVFPTAPGIVRRVSGQTLGGQQIFHFRPNTLTVSSSPEEAPWAFGLITVPLGDLAADGPNHTGLDPSVPQDADRMFLAPDAAMRRLVGLMEDVARVVRTTPWVIDEPAPAAALGGSVKDALLSCLTQGRALPDKAALRRHRLIVARFETALRERPEEMLSLSAICATVGVAERTLSLACREFLGQSAMQYARGRRLDAVRLRLLASDPARTQVTGVAMHYGFWELGRFAQAYRLRFGERPSETLRRAPARVDRT